MNSFAILVDTNCDLPPELMEEYGIETIAMPFELDGKSHDSGYWQKISDKEYYDALRNGGVAKTAQINPETFIELFTKYAEQGQDLLYIALSSGLSSTFQNSVMAAKEVKEKYPDCNIFPVDSISATVGHGLLTIMAAKKRDEGLSVGKTATWLEERKHKCLGFFTVDDLMYLHRGGRLSKLSAIAGSIIGIKPVLNLAPNGTLALKDKARGLTAAFKLMASQLKRSLNPDSTVGTVVIAHTDCEESAKNLEEIVRATVNVRQVIVMMMGPVIGAHLGPGSVVMLCECDMTRNEYENKFYNKK